MSELSNHLITNREIRNDVAALLSVLPGLGQIYKGYFGTGLLLLLGTPIVMIAAFLAALGTAGVGLVLIPLFYWGVTAVHAYRVPPKHHHFHQHHVSV